MKTISAGIKTVLLALLCLLCSCGAEISLRKGDQRYALGEYTEAASYYKKAYAGRT